MKRDKLFAELRKLNIPVPKPLTLPSDYDIKRIEVRLGVVLPADFKDYLLHVSDVVYGTIEPVNATRSTYYTYIEEVFTNLRQLPIAGVMKESLYPICEDNSNFYCMDNDGVIHFISHNGTSNETWKSLYEWIEKVWLAS